MPHITEIDAEPAYAVLWAESNVNGYGPVYINTVVYRTDPRKPETRTYHARCVDPRFADDTTPLFHESGEATAWMVTHPGQHALVEVEAAQRLRPDDVFADAV